MRRVVGRPGGRPRARLMRHRTLRWADTLAFYLALTEHATDSSLASVAERAGLPAAEADDAIANSASMDPRTDR